MSSALKLLAIESSTRRCEIVLGDGQVVLASALLPADRRPTAELVPAIGRLCRRLGWSVRELGLICVDIGPGSYTGLRVGLTCGKALAYAAAAPLATAESLAVAAQNAGPQQQTVEVAFDAARGQVFAARFHHAATGWKPAGPVQILQAEQWAERLLPAALVLGPALERYRHLVPPSCRLAEPDQWWPRAEAVARLAWQQFRSQPIDDYWPLEPLYLRPSAAEEKRAGR